MDTVRAADLERMKKTDIRAVDRDSLVDITDVHIDEKLPRAQRFAEFMHKVGNPYCFRCGGIVVKVAFADTDITLEDRLGHYLETL